MICLTFGSPYKYVVVVIISSMSLSLSLKHTQIHLPFPKTLFNDSSSISLDAEKLLFWVLSLFTIVATFMDSPHVMAAQSSNNSNAATILVNIRVVLDLKTWGGQMGLSCIEMSLSDFNSSNPSYKTRLVLNVRDSEQDEVTTVAAGVKRFVYISAADFGVVNYLLRKYYEGKRAAETELLTKFPYGGMTLRPGFFYGTRRFGSMKIPLGVVGAPLEMIFQHAKPLNQLPLVGPLFTPPVNVSAVAKVAV